MSVTQTKGNGKSRTLSYFTFDFDQAFMLLDDLMCQRQADAAPRKRKTGCIIRLVKTLEYMVLLVPGNTGTCVGDTYLHNFLFTQQANSDTSFIRRKFERVRKQVIEYFPNLHRIEPDRNILLHRFQLILYPVHHRIVFESIELLPHERDQVLATHMERHLTLFQAAEIEHLGNQLLHLCRILAHFQKFGPERTPQIIVLQQQVHLADHQRQRSSQFMRYIYIEFQLHLVQPLYAQFLPVFHFQRSLQESPATVETDQPNQKKKTQQTIYRKSIGRSIEGRPDTDMESDLLASAYLAHQEIVISRR